MELLAESNWIETSIQFLKKILAIVRVNVKPCPNSSSNLIQSEYAVDSPIEDMLFYIRILTEMSIMKKEYGINISIMEYTQVWIFLITFLSFSKICRAIYGYFLCLVIYISIFLADQ